LKKPSNLDESEWEVIRKHTILGAQLVAPIKKLADVAPIIECSHERYDGTGYPHGLKGDEIPFGARIVSVVDSYSAMRDERSYKINGHKDAMDEIKQNSEFFMTSDKRLFIYCKRRGKIDFPNKAFKIVRLLPCKNVTIILYINHIYAPQNFNEELHGRLPRLVIDQ
jgi:hypothetical protein